MAHTHEGFAPDHDAGPPSEHEILEAALRELLIDKGILSAAEINRQIERMDSRDPTQGAHIVAKAWSDAAFRERLLRAPREALAEMGAEFPPEPELVVIENRPERHNVVVCTLCSCYPRMVLGLPPAWYKSREYRARVVADPRGVLREFGTEIADEVEIRVHDSTADLRFLIIPERPEGTEGWPEEKLTALVTRDSMIGVARALDPDELDAD